MTKKFYELTPEERLDLLNLPEELMARFVKDQEVAHQDLVENYLTDFALPEGMVRHLVLDNQPYQVPMVTEEPSVIAAANNGARLFKMGGGFKSAGTSQAILGGQILFEHIDFEQLQSFVTANEYEIFQAAEETKPSLYRRGGGLRSINLRHVSGHRASLDILVDTSQSMGANAVNTILESIRLIFEPFDDQILGAILTNAGHQSIVSVTGRVPVTALGGFDAAQRIVDLADFAKVDPDRAVTENKGIFNGLSAVVLALGNDWRAVEAAGHAYASRNGQYQALTNWRVSDDHEFLEGEFSLPLNLGRVGGAIAGLTKAQDNLALLGNPTLDEMKKIVLSVGLSSNLAALKAIAGEGIQAGHMRMQARLLAISVGAKTDEIMPLAKKLTKAPAINEENAKKLLGELRHHESEVK